MKRILFILLLTIPFIGFGQGWEKTFGGTILDGGYSVQQTTDGGYIITGMTKSYSLNGGRDVYLIKTNSTGDTLWTNTFGGSDNEEGNSVKQTNDGGYIICGQTESFGLGYNDAYLIKTDSQGNEIWSQTFGGQGTDQGRQVVNTLDEGYLISGYTDSFGTLGGFNFAAVARFAISPAL